MPFVSKKQQRWMFATHPAMAKEWAAHTPDIKALPDKKAYGLSGLSLEALFKLADITPELLPTPMQGTGPASTSLSSVPQTTLSPVPLRSPLLSIGSARNRVIVGPAHGMRTGGVSPDAPEHSRPIGMNNKVAEGPPGSDFLGISPHALPTNAAPSPNSLPRLPAQQQPQQSPTQQSGLPIGKPLPDSTPGGAQTTTGGAPAGAFSHQPGASAPSTNPVMPAANAFSQPPGSSQVLTAVTSARGMQNYPPGVLHTSVSAPVYRSLVDGMAEKNPTARGVAMPRLMESGFNDLGNPSQPLPDSQAPSARQVIHPADAVGITGSERPPIQEGYSRDVETGALVPDGARVGGRAYEMPNGRTLVGVGAMPSPLTAYAGGLAAKPLGVLAGRALPALGRTLGLTGQAAPAAAEAAGAAGAATAEAGAGAIAPAVAGSTVGNTARSVGRYALAPDRLITEGLGRLGSVGRGLERVGDAALAFPRLASGNSLANAMLTRGASTGRKLLTGLGTVPAAAAAGQLGPGTFGWNNASHSLTGAGQMLTGDLSGGASHFLNTSTIPYEGLGDTTLQPLNRAVGTALAEDKNPLTAGLDAVNRNVVQPAAAGVVGGAEAAAKTTANQSPLEAWQRGSQTGRREEFIKGQGQSGIASPYTADGQHRLTDLMTGAPADENTRWDRAGDAMAKNAPRLGMTPEQGREMVGISSGRTPVPADPVRTTNEINDAITSGKSLDEIKAIGDKHLQATGGDPNKTAINAVFHVGPEDFPLPNNPEVQALAQKAEAGDPAAAQRLSQIQESNFANKLDVPSSTVGSLGALGAVGASVSGKGLYTQWKDGQAKVQDLEGRMQQAASQGFQPSPQLQQEYQTAKDTAAKTYHAVQGRALAHYEREVVEPLRSKELPALAGKIQALQARLADGTATDQDLQAAGHYREQAKDMTEKLTRFSLRKAQVELGQQGAGPEGLHTVADFARQASANKVVVDPATGKPAVGPDGQPVTKRAFPLGEQIDNAMKREALTAAQTNGQPPPSDADLKAAADSTPDWAKILMYGGMGMGLIGMIGSLLGVGGSLAPILGVLGVGAAGAGAFFGPAQGNVSNLFKGDTWRKALGFGGGEAGPIPATQQGSSPAQGVAPGKPVQPGRPNSAATAQGGPQAPTDPVAFGRALGVDQGTVQQLLGGGPGAIAAAPQVLPRIMAKINDPAVQNGIRGLDPALKAKVLPLIQNGLIPASTEQRRILMQLLS